MAPPVVGLLKLIAAPGALLQYIALLTAFTTGEGFTVIVPLRELLTHGPAVVTV